MLTAAVGIGALSGALTVAVLRPAGGSGRLMLAGLASMSAFTVAFGVSTWLPLSLVFLAGLGASQTTYYSTANTLIQVLVPSRLRGRVMSLYILLAIGLMPLGNLLAGLVAENWSAPVALAGGDAGARDADGLARRSPVAAQQEVGRPPRRTARRTT
jgi:MFS family permease